MIYDPVLNKLSISPISTTDLKTFLMEIKMITNYFTVTVNFEVTVDVVSTTAIQTVSASLQNLAPPMFDEDLPDIQLSATQKSSFSLPSISDADHDEFQVTANLGEAAIFATFEGTAFNFLPLPAHVRASPYIIKVKLTDKNTFPRSLTYPLFVYIKAQEATTTPSPPSQLSSTNTTQNSSSSQNPATTNSTANTTKTEVKPVRSISEAAAQGAQIKNAKGSIRIMKANQYGELKIVIRGDFLTDSMVSQISEQDFTATLQTQGKQTVPFKIKSRDPSAGTFVIELLFANPMNISANNDVDTLDLRTAKELVVTSGLRRRRLQSKNPNDVIKILTIPSGQVQRKNLPQQLSKDNAGTAQAIEKGAEMTSYIFLSGSLIINIFMSMFMNFIWDLLNDLSFMMILSFISISVPGLVQMIQSTFLSFIYMDLLQTDKWLPRLFFSNQNDDDDEALNQFFEINGFSSKRLINNLGSTFVFLMIFLSLHIFLLLMRCFFEGCTKCGDRIIKKLSEKLYWGGSIRFITQQYTPLALSGAINLYMIKYDSAGDVISIVLSIGIVAISPLLITLLSVILWRARRKQEASLTKDYGCLVEDLNTKGLIGTFWNILTLGRWILTVAIIVVLRESNDLQIIFLLLISILYLFLLVHGKPFFSNGEIALAAFNELMISCYLYLLMCLTDYNEAHSFREELGFGLLGTVFLTVIVNVANTVGLLLGICCRRIIRRLNNAGNKKTKIYEDKVLENPEQLNMQEEEKLPVELNYSGQMTQSTLPNMRQYFQQPNAFTPLFNPKELVSSHIRREAFHSQQDLGILNRLEAKIIMRANEQLMHQLAHHHAPQQRQYLNEMQPSFSDDVNGQYFDQELDQKEESAIVENQQENGIWSDPVLSKQPTHGNRQNIWQY
ncbi:hypothetical protein FGO68_gene12905 [Halteria grandinella]|uniref:TRP C-terminal domain-containing protein n=1 Tax=Halteria grandinella TaxID=5974 RepID=A0A8J8P2P0_HALGN|nr:hypothetical protein FGO68_gene12905 [Halteria grandinella]